MAQIQAGETFAIGQQFTASRANNHVNGAVLLPGAISDQVNITDPVASTDSILLHDASASALREATIQQIFQSKQDFDLGQGDFHSGTTKGTITVDDTNKVVELKAGEGTYKAIIDIVGSSGTDLTLAQGTVTIGQTSNNPTTGEQVHIKGSALFEHPVKIQGKLTLDTTSAVRFPVGNTAQRPASPVTGDIRYNTDTTNAEVYNGTAWEELGGGPFDGTGGDYIIAPSATVNSATFQTNDNGYSIVVTHVGHTVQPGQFVELTTAAPTYSGEYLCHSISGSQFTLRGRANLVNIVATSCTYKKSGNHKIHVYTTTGTSSFTAGPKGGFVDVLVVGGGGGSSRGGSGTNAGGGGGGVAFFPRFPVLPNEVISVTVGAGGVGAATASGNAVCAGQDSIFGPIIAYGGGGGSNVSPVSGGYYGGNNIGESPVYQKAGIRHGVGWGAYRETVLTSRDLQAFYRVNGGIYTSNILNIDKYFSHWGINRELDISDPDWAYKNSTDLLEYYYKTNNKIAMELTTHPTNGSRLSNTGSGAILAPTANTGANGGSGIVIVRYSYWI